MQLARGTIVGRYVILRPLGKGGMGVVYKAYDPELDRPVAVKLVAFDVRGDRPESEARQRLLREARALARLSHPHVVTVHDAGTFDGDVFVAMEFIAGRTLRAWLEERPRSAREILAVFLAAGAGLAAAHEAGIVHRDFKPENVMIGDDGRVRVLDFGLARPVVALTTEPAPDAPSPAGSPELTRSGAVLGTPRYMAPEQDEGREVGPRSDQFSFCVALYEALYGQRPFSGETHRELAGGRASGAVRVPPKGRGAGARVRRAILTGLAPGPRDRHDGMPALLAALRGRSWLRPGLAAAALAVALAVAGGALVWGARARNAAADRCDGVHAAGRVWNDERRAALRDAFAATRHPRAGEIAADVTRALDALTGEWRDERLAVCRAAGASDPALEHKAADRLQCLERRLSQLDAQVTLLTRAVDIGMVDGARAGIGDLPRPRDCSSLAPPPMSGATLTAEEEPLLHDMMRARLAQSAGRLELAQEILVPVVARARALGSPGLALALYFQGSVEAARGQIGAARQTLLAAVRKASEIKEDGIVAEAWIELVGLAMRERRFDGPYERAVEGAEIALARLGPDEERRAKLAFILGSTLVAKGDLERAVEELSRARDGYVRAGASDHRMELATVENSLGMAYVDLGKDGEAEAAFARALEVWKTLGPENPLLATTLNNQAMHLYLRGRYAEAESIFLRALSIDERALGKDHVEVAVKAYNLGQLYADRDRCEEAVPLLARAEKTFIAVLGAESAAVGMPLLGKATCALKAGDAAGALGLLRRARAVAEASPVSTRELPEIDFALAQASWQLARERRGALALAERARAGFARLPGAANRRRAVEEWMAGRVRGPL